MSNSKKFKGFTLIELMVVIAVMSILALIGFGIYSGIQTSARDATRKADIDAIASAYEDGYNPTAGTYNYLTASQFTNKDSQGQRIIPSAPVGTPSYTWVDGPAPSPPPPNSVVNTSVCGSTCFKVCTQLSNGTTYCRNNQQGSKSEVAFATPTPTPAPTPTPTPTPSLITTTLLTANGTAADPGSTVNTASISPSANKLVIVMVASRLTSGTANIPTISGANMTWVEIGHQYDSTNLRTLTLFRGLSASPGSGAITISFAGQGQQNVGWAISEFGNIDITGTNGSGAIIQFAGNTTTGTNSGLTVTLAAFSNVKNATYGAIRMSMSTAPAEGSGFSALSAVTGPGGGVFWESEWKNTNDTTVDWTWASSSQTPVGMAVEIKAL